MAFKNNPRKKKNGDARRTDFPSQGTGRGSNPSHPKADSSSVKKTAAPLPLPVPASRPRFPGEEIPELYNQTFMCALPRDPETIFTYWEIAEPAIRRLKEKIGEDTFKQAKWVLRVQDVTHIFYDGANAWRSVTLEIDGSANEWYVQVPESGRTYMLECGLLTPGSVFFCLVNSNTCTVRQRGVRGLSEDQVNTVRTEEIIRMSLDAMRGGADVTRSEGGFYVNLGEGSGSGSVL